MIRSVLSFALGLFTLLTWGQTDTSQFARWHLRVGLGASFTLSPAQAQPSDYLLELGGNGILAGPFSVRYFINERWGFEAQLNKSHPLGGADFREKFYTSLGQRYSPDFFVRTDFSDSEFIQGDKPQITLGVVHQTRKNRWFFHQYAGVGHRRVHVYSADAILKERGSNTYLSYELLAGKRMVSGFVLSGSVGVSYQLRDRLMVQCEAIVSRFDGNFSFKEKTTDLYTQEVTSRKIEYTRAFHQLYLSAGVAFLVDTDPVIPRSESRRNAQ